MVSPYSRNIWSAIKGCQDYISSNARYVFLSTPCSRRFEFNAPTFHHKLDINQDVCETVLTEKERSA